MSSEALPARELMDRVYRHQRHVYDLTRKHYLLGRDHLIDRLEPPAGSHVLELGCGTGRNLIAAAKRYPDARFHGVDISGAMLATARRSIAVAGLDGRIHLVQGDATRVDPALFGLQRFERIFFSYSLSMIPAWRQALGQGAELVAPGGRLSLVDFGQQEGLPLWFKHLLFAWLSRFYVRPSPDLADAVAQIAMDVGAPFSFVDLYRGYACYAEIRRPAQSRAHATPRMPWHAHRSPLPCHQFSLRHAFSLPRDKHTWILAPSTDTPAYLTSCSFASGSLYIFFMRARFLQDVVQS